MLACVCRNLMHIYMNKLVCISNPAGSLLRESSPGEMAARRAGVGRLATSAEPQVRSNLQPYREAGGTAEYDGGGQVTSGFGNCITNQ